MENTRKTKRFLSSSLLSVVGAIAVLWLTGCTSTWTLGDRSETTERNLASRRIQLEVDRAQTFAAECIDLEEGLATFLLAGGGWTSFYEYLRKDGTLEITTMVFNSTDQAIQVDGVRLVATMNGRTLELSPGGDLSRAGPGPFWVNSSHKQLSFLETISDVGSMVKVGSRIAFTVSFRYLSGKEERFFDERIQTKAILTAVSKDKGQEWWVAPN